MFPGEKKRILGFVSRHFGKNPMDFPDAPRCRERLDQIRILHDTFFAAEEGNALPCGTELF